MRGGLVPIPSSRDFSLQGLSQAMHPLGTGSRREEPSLSSHGLGSELEKLISCTLPAPSHSCWLLKIA